MSHKASHWLADIPAEAMTHGAFRVLFHLCDAHNSQRHPSTACFPSQAFLMRASGLSSSGLNKVLGDLESRGFLRRRRTRNADGTQGPTYYILGCDADETQPTPLSGVGIKREHEPSAGRKSGTVKPVDNSADKCMTDSTLAHSPTPLEHVHRLHRGGDKPVIEPIKKPVSDLAVDPMVKMRARRILSGIASMCSSISEIAAYECFALGLVTVEDCRRVNIKF